MSFTMIVEKAPNRTSFTIEIKHEECGRGRITSSTIDMEKRTSRVKCQGCMSDRADLPEEIWDDIRKLAIQGGKIDIDNYNIPDS